MAWPNRINWLAWIGGIVIVLVLVIVGYVVINGASSSVTKQVGDSMNKAGEE